MLIIRLQRIGRKNEPTFRLVLTDSKNSAKSGKFLEILGSYDARDKNVTNIKGEAVKAWIAKGAQVSDTVHNLLITHKIIEGKKINVLPKKSPIIDEATLKAEADAKAAAYAEAKAKKEAEAAEAAAKVAAEKAAAEAPVETAPEAPVETPVETV